MVVELPLTRTIALIGMMGAGKSTVGRLLARRVDAEFFDSDAYIEKRYGKTVAQIFKDHGEAAFRDWEATAVCDALETGAPVILGVAGGAVLRQETRDALREHATVVWLEAPIDVLIDRVTARHLDRPMLGDDPAGAMRRLYVERQPIYRDIADQVVDVANNSPQVNVDLIVADLG